MDADAGEALNQPDHKWQDNVERHIIEEGKASKTNEGRSHQEHADHDGHAATQLLDHVAHRWGEQNDWDGVDSKDVACQRLIDADALELER